MLHERLELGAARGQLRVSPTTGARTVLAAVTGAALSLISQPDRFGDDTFATQLREAVIASATTWKDATSTTSKRRRGAEPTLATAAATLGSRLAAENTPLSEPELALMQQWLTTLADTHARSTAGPESPAQRGSRKERSQ